MMALDLLIRTHLSTIHLKEGLGLSWMFSSDIMKSSSCNIVCLALAYQAIVLEDILLFRLITF